MKIPLRFQMIEEDNGKETVLNVINYLFDREEIDKNLIKKIDKHYDEESLLRKDSVCKFITKLLKAKKYNLSFKELKKENVNLKNIKEYTKQDFLCAVVGIYLKEKIHYVILTRMDNNYVYLFDPYYLDDIYFDEERMVEIVFDEPFVMNRKVNLKRFTSLTFADFAMGPVEQRECLIIKKLDA